VSGFGDVLCRQCRESEDSRGSRSSDEMAISHRLRDGLRACARCGVPLTAEEQDDFLSRMLRKFGLLGEGGTLLERRERGA
jgi:hypothetical protein